MMYSIANTFDACLHILKTKGILLYSYIDHGKSRCIEIKLKESKVKGFINTQKCLSRVYPLRLFAYGYAEVKVLRVASKFIVVNKIYLKTWTVQMMLVQTLSVVCTVLSVSVETIVNTVVVWKVEIHSWYTVMIKENANVMKRLNQTQVISFNTYD